MKFVLELKKTIVTEVECETAEGAVVMAMTDDDPDGLWAKAEPVVTVLLDFQPAPTYPLTDTQYAQKLGLVCPNCGSTEVTAETPQTDGGVAWASCECGTCKAMWDDQYSLTGYGNLTPFDPPQEKTECTDCGLPTTVDDYGLCNACHDQDEKCS